MDKKIVNRALSLTVALEMFLSPLAMARADTPDPQAVQPTIFVEGERAERPEDLAGETPAVDPGVQTPAVDDTPDVQTPAGGDADVQAPVGTPDGDASASEPTDASQTGSAGSGASEATPAEDTPTSELLANSTDYVADMSFGIPLNYDASCPARYDGYFKWEGGSALAWGYRAYGSGDKYFFLQDDKYYTFLPDPGRLPDLKLEGFYVLPKAPSNWYVEMGDSNATEIRKWTYDETWTTAVRLAEADAGVKPDDPRWDWDVDYSRGDYAGVAFLTVDQLDQLEAAGIVQGDYWVGRVPIVARWVDSDQAQIAFLSATTGTDAGTEAAVPQFYTENPTGVAAPGTLTLADIDATTFAGQRENEFWLQVPEDQASLTLKFQTYEPYYDYHVKGEGACPVQVSARFNGEAVTRADGSAVTVQEGFSWDENGEPTDPMFPMPAQDAAGYDYPRNTAGAPARGRWTVADIPLAKVTDAVDMDDPYTTVTITVDAPDGTRATYILHVERLMTPTYQLGLGNTPLAMIEKDQKGNWGSDEAVIRANKDAAKEDFRQYYRLGNSGIVAPGDYTYYKSQFDPLAWRRLNWEGNASYNIDLDETAVVAYQDTAFADPGVSFVGSNGRKVVFGDTATGDYQTCVTRTIELRAADKLAVDLYGNAGAGTKCWYNPDAGTANRLTTDEAQSSQVLRSADGSDGVDLRGLNVLPGVYTMTYTFTDPLDPADPVVAKRPLVVLPIPGDVDMDGAVTVADALTLVTHQSDWESSAAADVQLLRYRVLGNVTAEKILNGFQPVLANLGQSDYFYPPLPVPADAQGTYTRKTWDQVEMPGSATLSLRYLGLEQGILQGEEGYTTPATDGKIDLANGKMGPWQTDPDGAVTLGEVDLDGNYKYGYYQTDTFWVGVYLDPGELAGSTVEDLTLSLIYDSSYVQPAVVYTVNQFPSAETQEARWYRSFFDYNFGAGSKLDGAPQTLFSGKTTSDYTYESGTTWGRPYATHYSKVIGELEQLQTGNQSSLKEMVISIQGKTAIGNSRVTLPTGEVCVLVVPFQLIHHPMSDRLDAAQEARLVELGAGMRDFNLVTKAAPGSAQGVSAADMFGRLFAAMDDPQSRALSAGDVTYAFSAQDSIYGGTTQNLREKVAYEETAGRIPIGENKTPTQVLKAATYAETYAVRLPNGTFSGDLPTGLMYIPGATEAYIRGTPGEVGEGAYRFTITQNGREYYYTLPVNKKTIHFRPAGCGSYYGQPEYRGTASANFTFTYDVSDLAWRDLPEGVDLTGAGAELADILGEDYVAPTFTAKTSRDDTATAVTEKTGIGVYPIVVDWNTGLDDKYELVLDESTLNTQALQIYPRPVWIDHLTADAAATGVQVYSDGDRMDRIITLTETDPTKPMIHLTLRDGSIIDGMYSGRPLTGAARVEGDVLTFTFAGEFQRNQQDKDEYPDNQDMFYMTSGSETRAIGKVTISEQNRNKFNTDNPNYTLVQAPNNGVLEQDGTNDIQGTLLRREITELRMVDYPSAMEGGSVTYGKPVSLQDLRICIFRNGQQIGDRPYDELTYDYNGSMAQAMDIHYNWVTAEEMREGLKAENLDTVVGSGCTLGADGKLQDTKSYKDTNEYLDMSLDGYYLCAIARKFENNDPNATDQGKDSFKKCYSANPIHVVPQEVTLTLNNMTRFYGEESAQPTYTYDVNALSNPDQRKLQEHYGANHQFGDFSELEWLLESDEKFTKPTVQFMKTPNLPESDTDENIVTVDTDATNTTYYQVISGATATNYTFRYARVDGDKAALASHGTAYLTIMKRPIVVEDLYSMYGTAEGGYQDTFATIYADSKNLLLTDQVDNGVHTGFEATTAEGATNQVTFTAPNYDADTQTVTYYSGGNSNVSHLYDMVYSGDPVRSQDLGKLGVTYHVRFLPDAEKYTWNSLVTNYYDVEALNATGGRGQRSVEIRDLQLTGEKADNYMLVYKESFHATEQAPANAVYTRAPSPGEGANAAFLQYGTGLVILRPIESMDIKYVGCMEYTYGEHFAPDNPGPSGKQFTLSVQYATQYDNYPRQYVGDVAHNIDTEEIPYTIEDGESTTFSARNFHIHYIDTATQRPEDVAPDKQILEGGEALYPTAHNGKHLFVSGRRGDSDPLVCSSITDEVLKIDQAALTLTARDVHRYYGEANADGYVIPELFDPDDDVKPFTFTFQASQLADWDREKMGALLGVEIGAVDTLTQAQLEEALEKAAQSDDPADKAWAAGFGYQAPTITTAATETSPINTTDGRWGEYPITTTVTSFTNYQVSGVGAKLYVYPRPIYITSVPNSRENPVYTIYSATDGTIFNTSFGQERVNVARSNAATGTVGWTRSLANSTASAHLKLSGDALVGEDQLTYKARVQYLEDTTLPDGVTDAFMDVVLTISQTGLGSSAGDAQRNYVLTRAYEEPRAVGAIKLRTIDYILIEDIPKAKYIYGDTLDLSSLKVRVVYMALGDESSIAERVTVKYEDPNQFQSYGLYVNYWDTRYDTVPTDADGLKSLPTAYRKAATGDHVTIAPTHDTQQYLGNDMSKPLQRPFSANGTGLIVSAFQAGDKQTPAQPKVVAARATPIEGAGVSSYEVTDANNAPFKFTVDPLRLTYTVSATDKTYNGDNKTAGTLRLTNVFDRSNVQTTTRPNAHSNVQDPVRETVTDVVYVPVGAEYEDLGERYTSYIGTAYQVQNGSIAFTTGAYARHSTGYLDKNDAVVWANGYQWGKGLLEFTFPNANVHYVDDSFADGLPGVGTADLAQYWRASQDVNTADGRWDSFPEVSQMPVEIRNMNFQGPDAANYTWAPSSEPRTYETDLTLDSDPAAVGAGQGSMPYATIYKANRQPIQELLAGDFVLPRLQVDVHSNVVRLTYGEDLSKIDDRTNPTAVSVYERPDGNVLNDTGEEDYRDELHFEYALAYKDAEGLLTQWAGKNGDSGYQDTLFFGGEVYLPEIDPAYVPDLDRLDKIEDAREDTVYKGQRYRWAQEDTGLSEGGYREDSGFYIDPSAYPGYATYGEAVRDAYWYLDLYNTDRTGLPRDTVYYPLVRLAETHNYNPSADLTGDADGDGQSDVSAQDLYAAQVAAEAYRQGKDSDRAEALKADALAKAERVFAAGAGMEQAARKQAQDAVDRDAALSADSLPEVQPEQPEPLCAVKTYRQRLDMVSASWERNSDGSGGQYLVKLVEDVKFTDTHLYPDQRLLDAVIWNNPPRYYGYAWDPDMSAQLRFGDAETPIDLDTEMTFTIRQRQPDGSTVESLWTYDPEGSNHTVQIYVKLTSGGGQTVRKIKIVPSVLYARLGDKPIQLGLITEPKMPTNRRYTWTTSDPSVATVSPSGLVTIRGEGTCVITVTTTNRRSDSITVVVSPVLPVVLEPGAVPIFNFYYAGPWATLDANYAFHPKDPMTRGEVVRLLDLFINPELGWTATRELAYVDVTGKERYYGALARLTKVGVVKGVPGSAFAGERLATRAEFVTMLARMLELDTPDTIGMAHAFADSGEDATWAYAYIDAVAKAGVIQGTGGGYFAPSRPITREEAAAIIARLVVNRLDRDNLVIPSDMTPENWSYPAVLRAVNSVMAPGFED